MPTGKHRLCRVRVACITAILIGVLPGLAVSQERGEAQAAYLQAVGLEQEAQELERVLLERLRIRKPFMLDAHQQGMARFFAFVMTVNGLDATKAQYLGSHGIDLVHAITADRRPLSEQALLADLVVVGEVVGLADSPEPDDGFRSSITVAVETVLKGSTPADTVFIRQRTRLANDAMHERAARDLYPELGERYVFLLSNGMYRFFVASHGSLEQTPPEAVQAQHFSIYRSYRMDGSRLLWNRYSRRATKRAFKELQKLHDLLNDF